MIDLSDKDVETLSIAIVQQAAEDYASAFNGYIVDGKTPEYTIADLNNFFHSDWYKTLTSVDGDYIVRHVKMQELDKMIFTYKQALSDARTSHIKIHVNKISSRPATEHSPARKEVPAIDYILPPKLSDALFIAMRRQLTELEKERENLETELEKERENLETEDKRARV